MGEIFGGPLISQPLNQVIGPGAEGYVPFDDYRTPGNEGDPGTCKRLLSAAGYPERFDTRGHVPNLCTHPCRSLPGRCKQTDFAKCGVTVIPPPAGATFDIFQERQGPEAPDHMGHHEFDRLVAGLVRPHEWACDPR